MARREFDVVVFGATGFTGGLVVNYLAETYSKDSKVRWALAGRDKDKMQKIQTSVAAKYPELSKLQALVVNSSDAKSVAEMCAKTSVVLTTVGPYLKYGEPLVAACVTAGTHYVDLTGETPFIINMIDKYHEQAKAKGVRIVHSCGFDSIPADIGALFVANELLTKHNTKARLVKAAYKMNGGASGGTLASACAMMELPKAELKKILNPYCINTKESQEALKGKTRKEENDQKWVRKDKDLGLTIPFVMAAANTRIVRRSASLFHEAVKEKRLDSKKNPFGEDFAYNESTSINNYWIGALVTSILGFVFILLNIAPIRRLLQKYVFPAPGEGPSEAKRAKSSFEARLIGYGENDTKVQAIISGGDPGYSETAKMIAESALCLAFDDLPDQAGVLTPATACGLALVPRLNRAKIRVEIEKS